MEIPAVICATLAYAITITVCCFPFCCGGTDIGMSPHEVNELEQLHAMSKNEHRVSILNETMAVVTDEWIFSDDDVKSQPSATLISSSTTTLP